MAGLMRREGETWDALLLRLNEAVMQSVIENRLAGFESLRLSFQGHARGHRPVSLVISASAHRF
jgi:hypothetical protein